MKQTGFLLISVFLLASCAAYKHLEPEPEISPEENDYIELKDDKDFFELDEGKKYYIAFPSPLENNFYLLIKVSDDGALTTVMSTMFDKNEGPGQPITNEAPAGSEEKAYAVNRTGQTYYWVIERVPRDMKLLMNYRYLPQWRYQFETQYEAFTNILAENRGDRAVYDNIGVSLSWSNFNFGQAISRLENKTANLETLQDQLASIERLFPPSILNSGDEAYLNYVRLKEDIEIELTFQENFRNALLFFSTMNKTENDMAAFVKALPELNAFFGQKQRYSNNVIDEARRMLEARLDELGPYFEDVISRKNNNDPLMLDPGLVRSLAGAAGVNVFPSLDALLNFSEQYNEKARAYQRIREEADKIEKEVVGLKRWPDNSFFNTMASRSAGLLRDLPSAGFDSWPKYRNSAASKALNNGIYALRSDLLKMEKDYRDAAQVVARLNNLAATKNYRDMIVLVNRNSNLGFLKSIYSDLDTKYVDRQESLVKSALTGQNWQQAESNLRELHNQSNFINAGAIATTKQRTVKTLEDSLLSRVESATRQRVDQFVNEQYNTLNNVEALYQSPVFDPVWDITFTSGSQSQLAARKQQLRQRLTRLKEVEFPAKAIQFLYKDFSANINENGVAKARAIVVHGNNYKGSDQSIKRLVAECDPYASKWLTKTTEYRKMYALPVTSNPAGTNTYVFRVNIRIPTDARFPVYDVNIKLPREVAQSAGSRQWYEEITMNKNVLKNEGRFMITSPNAENDYTALITPLQTEKDGDSVLEVRFDHNSYKVFEVSVMAQKPILRKNP